MPAPSRGLLRVLALLCWGGPAGCGASYEDGPRVGNGAWDGHCTDAVYSFELAQTLCDASLACSVLHSYDCQGEFWRPCWGTLEEIVASGGGTAACTRLAVPTTTVTVTPVGAFQYLDGPLVSNDAWVGQCSSEVGGLEDAIESCNNDPTCNSLHSHDCHPWFWRTCSGSTTDLWVAGWGGVAAACTKGKHASSTSTISTTTISTTTISTTTISLTATQLYVDGPRVDNGAFVGYCSSGFSTLESAEASCSADPACVALHSFNCQDWAWRYCTGSFAGMQAAGDGTDACTRIHRDLFTTTETSTTGTSTVTTAIAYVDGPRLGNGACSVGCIGPFSSLAQVKVACRDDAACTGILFSYSCQNWAWFYAMRDIHDMIVDSPGSSSCTMVSESVMGMWPTRTSFTSNTETGTMTATITSFSTTSASSSTSSTQTTSTTSTSSTTASATSVTVTSTSGTSSLSTTTSATSQSGTSSVTMTSASDTTSSTATSLTMTSGTETATTSTSATSTSATTASSITASSTGTSSVTMTSASDTTSSTATSLTMTSVTETATTSFSATSTSATTVSSITASSTGTSSVTMTSASDTTSSTATSPTMTSVTATGTTSTSATTTASSTSTASWSSSTTGTATSLSNATQTTTFATISRTSSATHTSTSETMTESQTSYTQTSATQTTATQTSTTQTSATQTGTTQTSATRTSATRTTTTQSLTSATRTSATGTTTTRSLSSATSTSATGTTASWSLTGTTWTSATGTTTSWSLTSTTWTSTTGTSVSTSATRTSTSSLTRTSRSETSGSGTSSSTSSTRTSSTWTSSTRTSSTRTSSTRTSSTRTSSTLTSTSSASQTTLTSATATSTETPLKAERFESNGDSVEGSLTLTVESAVAFVEDQLVKATLEALIASVAGVQQYQVTVEVGLETERRILTGRSLSDVVLASYTILLVDEENSTSVADALGSASPAAMTSALQQQLQNAGFGDAFGDVEVADLTVGGAFTTTGAAAQGQQEEDQPGSLLGPVVVLFTGVCVVVSGAAAGVSCTRRGRGKNGPPPDAVAAMGGTPPGLGEAGGGEAAEAGGGETAEAALGREEGASDAGPAAPGPPAAEEPAAEEPAAAGQPARPTRGRLAAGARRGAEGLGLGAALGAEGLGPGPALRRALRCQPAAPEDSDGGAAGRPPAAPPPDGGERGRLGADGPPRGGGQLETLQEERSGELFISPRSSTSEVDWDVDNAAPAWPSVAGAWSSANAAQWAAAQRDVDNAVQRAWSSAGSGAVPSPRLSPSGVVWSLGRPMDQRRGTPAQRGRETFSSAYDDVVPWEWER